MAVIRVPKVPDDAYNPDRRVSALLKMQIEHMHDAEKRLPTRYRSEIYPNAIKTEGEAAEYIRLVTEGIHDAHADAAARRAKPAKKRKGVIEISAVADERSERQTRRKAKKKKNGKKN